MKSACDLAAERNKMAAQLSDEEIHLAITRNAVFANTDSDFEKVAFAITALPPGITNISEAKTRFSTLLNKLVDKGEISSAARDELCDIIPQIRSVDDLFVSTR
ncbi:MAG: hypothetical protein ACFFDT_40875 [Candidatus Hodarchaeota archaeon]